MRKLDSETYVDIPVTMGGQLIAVARIAKNGELSIQGAPNNDAGNELWASVEANRVDSLVLSRYVRDISRL